MGNGLLGLNRFPQSDVKPYMGGKKSLKYWKNDIWPELKELFEKLAIDDSRGWEIYSVFLKMDKDYDKLVNIDDFFDVIGKRSKTKFTERLFFIPNERNVHDKPQSLNFKDTVLFIYKFLSLNVTKLCQMVFEIYDIDNSGYLERPDIESLYTYLWDCDDHDERFMSTLPFNKEKKCKKDSFINHCEKKRDLIEPVIKFQKKLRKIFGGIIMWEILARHRNTNFSVFDSQSGTLEQSMYAIIMSEDPNIAKKKKDLEIEMENQKLKLIKDAEEAQEQLELRLKEVEEERYAMALPTLRPMEKAWKRFERKKERFIEAVYSLDDVVQRNEERLEIFEVLDDAIEKDVEHGILADEETINAAVGCDADHEARYQTWRKEDKDANSNYNRNYLKILMKHMLENIEEEKKNSKKKIKTTVKTEKELQLTASLLVIEREVEHITHYKSIKKRINHYHQLEKEKLVAGKYAKKNEKDYAHECTKDLLYDELKAETLSNMYEELEKTRTDRIRKQKISEYEVATRFGSRITKWERVWDKPNDRMCYINFDTMEIIHIKTAICENCDNCFEQTDVKCTVCDTPRSGPNQHLFRPLGYKDIRID
jgi:hypothetical protein